MTNTRDIWSERVFQRWLDDRVYKYPGHTLARYRHDAELGLIEGLSRTVSDTVTAGASGDARPEKQEESTEDQSEIQALRTTQLGQGDDPQGLATDDDTPNASDTDLESP